MARRHVLYTRALRQPPDRWSRQTRDRPPIPDVVFNPPSTQGCAGHLTKPTATAILAPTAGLDRHLSTRFVPGGNLTRG
jgi:hypothetical protein